jgi:polar amino acid transport system substrate-binding protein
MRFVRHLLAGAALAFAVSPAAAQVCDDPLTIGWEPWPPYQIEKDGEIAGFDAETFQAISEEMGCKIVHKRLPWKRHLKMLAAGKVDMAAWASKTEERAAYANFSDFFMPFEAVLFTQAGSGADHETLEGFLKAGNKLGTVADYSYGADADAVISKAAYEANILPVRSLKLNIRKLARGRIDGLIGSPFTVSHMARQVGLDDKIAASDLVVNSSDTFVMFSKKSVNQETIDAFNKALATLRDNGTLDRIIAKYTEAGS